MKMPVDVKVLSGREDVLSLPQMVALNAPIEETRFGVFGM